MFDISVECALWITKENTEKNGLFHSLEGFISFEKTLMDKIWRIFFLLNKLLFCSISKI